METLVLTSNDTVVSAAAPPVSEYCAENTTALPLPDAGVTDTAGGNLRRRSAHADARQPSHAASVLADWIAPTSGRFTELVWPPRNMLPLASTAMALATSDPLPPNQVEKPKALPVEFNFETKASYESAEGRLQRRWLCGKSPDEV